MNCLSSKKVFTHEAISLQLKDLFIHFHNRFSHGQANGGSSHQDSKCLVFFVNL